MRKFMNRFLRRLSRGRVYAGGRAITFNTLSPAASRLRAWKPDWKTDAINRILTERPGLFLDIGANVGQTMLDYLSCPLRRGYVGFEPNPRACAIVQTLIRDNKLSDCVAVPVGLAETTGLRTLHSRASHVDGSASIVPGLRPAQERQTEHISCYRADDILPEVLNGSPVSLVKIDVEGAELAVLQGMPELLRTGPWIICEVLGRDPSSSHDGYRDRISSLAERLSASGYSIFRILKNARSVSGISRAAEFPDVVWSQDNRDDFDYLFLPASDQGRAQQLLG
jgi:FkbM family methyltransferase